MRVYAYIIHCHTDLGCGRANRGENSSGWPAERTERVAEHVFLSSLTVKVRRVYCACSDKTHVCGTSESNEQVTATDFRVSPPESYVYLRACASSASIDLFTRRPSHHPLRRRLALKSVLSVPLMLTGCKQKALFVDCTVGDTTPAYQREFWGKWLLV